MSRLTLSLREPLRYRLDASSLTPNTLAGRSQTDVAALPLWYGNRKVIVGELFEVVGEPLPWRGELVFANATGRLDRVGAGMSAGTITVAGDVGAYAGFGMTGGKLAVSGNTGPFTASAMRQGEIRIGGDAGDFLGAAIPGEAAGMNGGVVVVSGNAGERVGDHMRRGNILIAGDAGDYCGARMTAGSIVVQGRVGDFVGFAMRRGTLLLYRPLAHRPATFTDCGGHDLQFLGLYLDYLNRFGAPFTHAKDRHVRVHKLAGDIAVDGKGEILVLEL
ncbi:MAG: formylmethanofuran dehydrogenase subunit C [Alphaproteobacteria bacterium]